MAKKKIRRESFYKADLTKALANLAEIEMFFDSIAPGEHGWSEDAIREGEDLCGDLRSLLEAE